MYPRLTIGQNAQGTVYPLSILAPEIQDQASYTASLSGTSVTLNGRKAITSYYAFLKYLVANEDELKKKFQDKWTWGNGVWGSYSAGNYNTARDIVSKFIMENVTVPLPINRPQIEEEATKNRLSIASNNKLPKVEVELAQKELNREFDSITYVKAITFALFNTDSAVVQDWLMSTLFKFFGLSESTTFGTKYNNVPIYGETNRTISLQRCSTKITKYIQPENQLTPLQELANILPQPDTIKSWLVITQKNNLDGVPARNGGKVGGVSVNDFSISLPVKNIGDRPYPCVNTIQLYVNALWKYTIKVQLGSSGGWYFVTEIVPPVSQYETYYHDGNYIDYHDETKKKVNVWEQVLGYKIISEFDNRFDYILDNKIVKADTEYQTPLTTVVSVSTPRPLTVKRESIDTFKIDFIMPLPKEYNPKYSGPVYLTIKPMLDGEIDPVILLPNEKQSIIRLYNAETSYRYNELTNVMHAIVILSKLKPGNIGDARPYTFEFKTVIQCTLGTQTLVGPGSSKYPVNIINKPSNSFSIISPPIYFNVQVSMKAPTVSLFADPTGCNLIATITKPSEDTLNPSLQDDELTTTVTLRLYNSSTTIVGGFIVSEYNITLNKDDKPTVVTLENPSSGKYYVDVHTVVKEKFKKYDGSVIDYVVAQVTSANSNTVEVKDIPIPVIRDKQDARQTQQKPTIIKFETTSPIGGVRVLISENKEFGWTASLPFTDLRLIDTSNIVTSTQRFNDPITFTLQQTSKDAQVYSYQLGMKGLKPYKQYKFYLQSLGCLSTATVPLLTKNTFYINNTERVSASAEQSVVDFVRILPKPTIIPSPIAATCSIAYTIIYPYEPFPVDMFEVSIEPLGTDTGNGVILNQVKTPTVNQNIVQSYQASGKFTNFQNNKPLATDRKYLLKYWAHLNIGTEIVSIKNETPVFLGIYTAPTGLKFEYKPGVNFPESALLSWDADKNRTFIIQETLPVIPVAPLQLTPIISAYITNDNSLQLTTAMLYSGKQYEIYSIPKYIGMADGQIVDPQTFDCRSKISKFNPIIFNPIILEKGGKQDLGMTREVTINLRELDSEPMRDNNSQYYEFNLFDKLFDSLAKHNYAITAIIIKPNPTTTLYLTPEKPAAKFTQSTKEKPIEKLDVTVQYSAKTGSGVIPGIRPTIQLYWQRPFYLADSIKHEYKLNPIITYFKVYRFIGEMPSISTNTLVRDLAWKHITTKTIAPNQTNVSYTDDDTILLYNNSYSYVVEAYDKNNTFIASSSPLSILPLREAESTIINTIAQVSTIAGLAAIGSYAVWKAFFAKPPKIGLKK